MRNNQLDRSNRSQIIAPSRRDVLRTGTAAVGAAALASLAFPSGVYAKADGTLKLGLIGCGGRGSGAAVNALTADEGAELVAMGDMFPDLLNQSHENLVNGELGDRVRADDMKKFTGFDAYKGVIAESDVVLLATPPHFRPLHLRAAIDAGKHVFCEKPVAVDVPGLRKVMEACKIAKEKKLSVLSGLCYRYDKPKMEAVKRVHEGAIGDIISIQSHYLTTGLWIKPRQPGWDDMQWQLRNWLYFHWLSGDHVVEQAIHSLDKALWLMKDAPPSRVTAAGGRVQRTSPEYGNIYDHFNAVLEWPTQQRCYFGCRQWTGSDVDTSDYAFGNKGTCALHVHQITGANEWKGKPGANMYDAEHEVLFKHIRKDEPINNGDYMVTATMMAMMVRMSAYTGKTVYWDRAAADAAKAPKDAPVAWESTEDLTPPKYEFGPLPVAPVAVPGQTKFI